MPELAELRKMAMFINRACGSIVFDRITKSEVHKCDPIEKPFPLFTIRAESRGKEICLFLKNQNTVKGRKRQKRCQAVEEFPIAMRMGMSGCWEFVMTEDQLNKHAHLRFHGQDEKGILSFVDARRFGTWDANCGFNLKDRSPDPTLDFSNFCANIRRSIHKSAFSKPISVLLLDQRYFNGIGNYLRAEICHRAEVDAKWPARQAILGKIEAQKLEKGLKLMKEYSKNRSKNTTIKNDDELALSEKADTRVVSKQANEGCGEECPPSSKNLKRETSFISQDVPGDAPTWSQQEFLDRSLPSQDEFESNMLLKLCRDIPEEVIALNEDYAGSPKDSSKAFKDWLRVYGKGRSFQIAGRTMWVAGTSNSKKNKRTKTQTKVKEDGSVMKEEVVTSRDYGMKGLAKQARNKARNKSKKADSAEEPPADENSLRKGKKRRHKEIVAEMKNISQKRSRRSGVNEVQNGGDMAMSARAQRAAARTLQQEPNPSSAASTKRRKRKSLCEDECNHDSSSMNPSRRRMK